MIHREETTNSIKLSTERCTFQLERLQPGILLVTISGFDRGEFGMAVLDELTAEIRRFKQIELFIDATEAEGTTWDVSQSWTAWFRANRESLARVSMLVRSKYLHLTVSVAKELSRTGDLIALFTEADRFEEVIRKRVPSWTGSVRTERD